MAGSTDLTRGIRNPKDEGAQLTSAEVEWVIDGSQGDLKLVPIAEPGTDANAGQIYVDEDDDHLYYKDPSGNVVDLTTGGSSVSFGTAGQIPFTNATTDDFDYASGFSFSGDDLSIPDDLLLGSGAVINFNSGNATITHSTDTLSIDAPTTLVRASTGNLTLRASSGDWLAETNDGLYEFSSGGVQNGILDFSDVASTDKTFTFPNASGTIALTSDIPAAGANTALSNLSSVAINTTLVSDTTNTDDIGTASILWRTGYFGTSIELGHATQNTLTASGGILSIEGVAIPTISSSDTLTNKTIDADNNTISNLAIGAEVSSTVSGANGLDYNPGSDIDSDIITIGVTGAPRIFWDESQDRFSSTHGWEFGGSILPTVSNTPALGSTSLMWADLFLGSGAVINFNNGDVTITHASNLLTLAGGDLRVTTAGTNAASVVTVQGTQTLTNKRVQLRRNTTTSYSTSITPDKNSYDEYSASAQDDTITLNLPTNMSEGETMVFSFLMANTETFTPNASYIFAEDNDAPATFEGGWTYEVIVRLLNGDYVTSWTRYDVS